MKFADGENIKELLVKVSVFESIKTEMASVFVGCFIKVFETVSEVGVSSTEFLRVVLLKMIKFQIYPNT